MDNIKIVQYKHKSNVLDWSILMEDKILLENDKILMTMKIVEKF